MEKKESRPQPRGTATHDVRLLYIETARAQYVCLVTKMASSPNSQTCIRMRQNELMYVHFS
jgi:hypothetical protein